MDLNYISTPGAPMALPMPLLMYPSIETQQLQQQQNQQQQQQQQLYPPQQQPVFHNGQELNAQKLQTQPSVPESRPNSVFVLDGKPLVGPEPLQTKCPHCKVCQTTRVVSKISVKTHFAALLCCVLGLVCLAPIPYCMKAFKNLHHYCDNCGQYLGLFPAK